MPLVLTILCPPLLQEGAVGMVRLPLRGWRCSQSRACTTVTFSSESHKVCSYFFWLHCAMVKCFAFMEEGRHRHRKDFSVRETSTKTHLLLVNLSSFAWWTEPRAPDALRHVGLWLNGVHGLYWSQRMVCCFPNFLFPLGRESGNPVTEFSVWQAERTESKRKQFLLKVIE